MMNRWYENIPPQGVLCTINDNGETTKAVSYDKENDLVLSDKTDFEGDKENFYQSDLTPLTAEELWQFIPWQSMETAPKEKPILLISKTGVVQNAVFIISQFTGDVYLCADNETVYGRFNEFGGWLPLPKGDL